MLKVRSISSEDIDLEHQSCTDKCLKTAFKQNRDKGEQEDNGTHCSPEKIFKINKHI